jgi:3-dehydroquinate synthase
MTSQLKVAVPAKKGSSYPIQIGANILDSVWSQLQIDFARHGKFIVTDENLVRARHLNVLTGKQDIPTFVISPAGETSKNISTVVSIVEAMEKACLARDTVVVALGGGTVGDVAGFAAAIFKRGVPIVHIPTTTVAQADSAIGGKTGVDSSLSKNAFGVFWHPAAVYIDVATLITLNDRQFKAGLVESVKHALIADRRYFSFLEKNLDAIIQRDLNLLEKIAYFNCRIKGRVVKADPYEQNLRRVLNYGHTIGHAVEAASGYSLLHGEAVAVGIIAAGLIELELGLAKPERIDRVRRILEKLDLPVKLPCNLVENNLIELLKHDKKVLGGRPRFVLLRDIGEVYSRDGQWAVDVEPEVVERILNRL